MTYTIDIALAISYIIGTALQLIIFAATLSLRKLANKTIEDAQRLSEHADLLVSEAQKTNDGAMMCLKLANELFFCHTSDERANTIIKWMPKLQEAGISLDNIDEIINS